MTRHQRVRQGARLRSCSGDVHFALVHVIVLVVDVVGLMLVLSARVVVHAVVCRVSVANFLYLEVYSLHTRR